MKHVFLIDDLSRIKPEKDTSFALMLEVYALHGEVFFTHRGDLSLMNGKLHLDAYSCVPVDQSHDFFSKKKHVQLNQNDIDVFWIGGLRREYKSRS